MSSYLKDLIVSRGVDEKRVTVTPNAIDISRFANQSKSIELEKSLGLDGKCVIGFAGWFDHWDRLDLLVEVFASLTTRVPDLRLLLIGDGEPLDGVRQRSRELGIEDAVVLTGAVSRNVVHEYLSLLDVAVITHSNEFGSPVVMFEFMGLKIPVVAPRLTPVTDVLTDGETAVLFDRLDLEQLERKLEALIENEGEQKRLADNAYRTLVENHTWECNAEQIVRDAGL